MGTFEWYDFLRLVLAALASVIVIVEIKRVRGRWHNTTPRAKDRWWVFNALFVVIIYQLIEAIVHDVPFGPRTLFATVFIILIASRAVFHSRQGKYDEVPQ